MPSASADAVDFLQQIYAELNLDEGLLFPPSTTPTASTADYWQAIGDWLNLAERMNADRIFFVGDDPVIVFSAIPDGASQQELIKTYRQAWSLARPQCLFLASADELKVYDLSTPPPRSSEDWQSQPLQVLQRTANVAQSLAAYQRSQLESGLIFDENRFAGADRRADKQLISDIDAIATALRLAGLSPALAHTLIERVILVRYLEDRHVITADYLLDIARRHPGWTYEEPVDDIPLIFGTRSVFAQCLRNKDLAYDIFRRLAVDFNGDLFLVDDSEHDEITDHHLNLIFHLLTGDTNLSQQKLFLWAYDFSVVPISLISSMYEHFYHATNDADREDDRSGTHYTPPELVEYVLSKILTPEMLDRETASP